MGNGFLQPEEKTGQFLWKYVKYSGYFAIKCLLNQKLQFINQFLFLSFFMNNALKLALMLQPFSSTFICQQYMNYWLKTKNSNCTQRGAQISLHSYNGKCVAFSTPLCTLHCEMKFNEIYFTFPKQPKKERENFYSFDSKVNIEEVIFNWHNLNMNRTPVGVRPILYQTFVGEFCIRQFVLKMLL